MKLRSPHTPPGGPASVVLHNAERTRGPAGCDSVPPPAFDDSLYLRDTGGACSPDHKYDFLVFEESDGSTLTFDLAVDPDVHPAAAKPLRAAPGQWRVPRAPSARKPAAPPSIAAVRTAVKRARRHAPRIQIHVEGVPGEFESFDVGNFEEWEPSNSSAPKAAKTEPPAAEKQRRRIAERGAAEQAAADRVPRSGAAAERETLSGGGFAAVPWGAQAPAACVGL